jgi:hypothetical protein
MTGSFGGGGGERWFARGGQRDPEHPTCQEFFTIDLGTYAIRTLEWHPRSSIEVDSWELSPQVAEK